MHSATLETTSTTSSSQTFLQPINLQTTSDVQSTSETQSGDHTCTLPPTFPATPTTLSKQYMFHVTTTISNFAKLHQATPETDLAALDGTNSSPVLSTTPTTSATMSTTSKREDHESLSKATYATVLDLQHTSTPTSRPDCVTKPISAATPTTPADNKQLRLPRISPPTSLPNLKNITLSKFSPLNVQPTTPATSFATPTATDSTTGASQTKSSTMLLDKNCASMSSPSQSPCNSTTPTTSANATTTSTTTTNLPLDLHNATTATQSASDLSPLSPDHFNVSQPFHPGKLSRNQLPLEMKIEAIRLHEEEGLSGRSIMEVMNVHGFKCGKTQIQNILKRKHEWIEQYAQNVPLTRKRKLRKTANEEVNQKVYEWFEEALDRMVPVNGPMLQQKAVEIARELGITEFKGSNGWLESFRKRHSISFGKAHGEGAGDDNQAGGLHQRKEYRFMFERAKNNPHGNDPQNPVSELPQMIVGEFVKKSVSQSSSQKSATEENTGPKFPRMEKLLLKNKGNNWFKVPEKDVEEEGGSGELQIETDMDGKQTETEEGRGTLSHPKFKSIHEAAAALREMRIFFATNNYSHLLDSCLDLEEQVALECITKREAEEKSTVLDHLNPLDTRPSSNMDQP